MQQVKVRVAFAERTPGTGFYWLLIQDSGEQRGRMLGESTERYGTVEQARAAALETCRAAIEALSDQTTHIKGLPGA